MGIFGQGSFEGKRVHRVFEVGGVGTHGAEMVAHFHPLARTHVHVDLHAGSEHGVEVPSHDDAPGRLAVRRREAVKAQRRMERHGSFFGVRHDDIAGIHRVTTELNLRHRHLAAGIDHPHSGEFGIRLAHRFQHGMLAGKYLVAVHILQFAQYRILLARLVAASSQVHHFAVRELGGVRRLQPAGDEIGIRQELFTDEPGAV